MNQSPQLPPAPPSTTYHTTYNAIAIRLDIRTGTSHRVLQTPPEMVYTASPSCSTRAPPATHPPIGSATTARGRPSLAQTIMSGGVRGGSQTSPLTLPSTSTLRYFKRVSSRKRWATSRSISSTLTTSSSPSSSPMSQRLRRGSGAWRAPPRFTASQCNTAWRCPRTSLRRRSILL